MIVSGVSESIVEEAALGWLAEIGSQVACGPGIDWRSGQQGELSRVAEVGSAGEGK